MSQHNADKVICALLASVMLWWGDKRRIIFKDFGIYESSGIVFKTIHNFYKEMDILVDNTISSATYSNSVYYRWLAIFYY